MQDENKKTRLQSQVDADTRRDLKEVAEQLQRPKQRPQPEVARLPGPLRFALENLHLIDDAFRQETWLIKPSEAPDAACWNMLMLAKKNQAKFTDQIGRELLKIGADLQKERQERKRQAARKREEEEQRKKKASADNPTAKQIEEVMKMNPHARTPKHGLPGKVVEKPAEADDGGHESADQGSSPERVVKLKKRSGGLFG